MSDLEQVRWALAEKSGWRWSEVVITRADEAKAIFLLAEVPGVSSWPQEVYDKLVQRIAFALAEARKAGARLGEAKP